MWFNTTRRWGLVSGTLHILQPVHRLPGGDANAANDQKMTFLALKQGDNQPMRQPIQWCRDCGAEIFWAKWASGKAMPVDYNPVPEGTLCVRFFPGHVTVRFLTAEDILRNNPPRYQSHCDTCSARASNTKRRRSRPRPAVSRFSRF